MNSMICIGTVAHKRHLPVTHEFRYPLYMYVFDLDELPRLPEELGIFGYNRVRPVSIHDRDYLRNDGRSIKEKLFSFLREEGCADGVERVRFLTAARYFNYVFNPISLFYCYRADGSLSCVVAEVTNTFREKHLYLLKNRSERTDSRSYAEYDKDKRFHVSPFFDVRGAYAFHLSDLGPEVDIRIDYFADKQLRLVANLKGKCIPLTRGNLRRTILSRPLVAAMTMTRILYEASKLYFVKKLRFYPKPDPSDPHTVRAVPPTIIQRLARALVTHVFSHLSHGHLTVLMPDGATAVYGNGAEAFRGELVVRRNRFFTRCALHADVGFGEAYVDGDWVTGDLTGLMTLFAKNIRELNRASLRLPQLGAFANMARHRAKENTIDRAAGNIQEHYDLGNDFFETFLDPTLMYSCAVFARPDETLEEAQLRKIGMLIDKAQIRKEHRVLEIGSGWGGFAVEAAARTGCSVTTVTVSRRQYEYVTAKVARLGLAGKVDVQYTDYRHIRGSYDRIVSIEMLEAVGHRYFGKFFHVCDRLLNPDGRMVVQVITIPDERYDHYRVRTDWIQKHIFPGGLVPSLAVLSAAMKRRSGLTVREIENIGPHYSRTLREWRERLLANSERLSEMGFDEKFIRKWEYYFSYCEAGFTTGQLNNLQMVITRPVGD